MMAIAKTLIKQGVTNRKLYLFDTFDGMSTPIHLDKNYSGQTADDLLSKESKITSHTWAYSSLDEVKQNLKKSGYDEENIIFVKGKVEDTLPSFAPKHISLLRLDTDWYESTYHELLHLYPLLSIGGVLIIDDYGHWQGAKLAVDQYFNQNKLKLLLHRIDYTGRICVKLEN